MHGGIMRLEGCSGVVPQSAQTQSERRPKRLRACGGSTSARPCACMRVCEHVRAIQCVHALARARFSCFARGRHRPAVGSAAAVTQCAQRLRASRTATAHEATLQRQSARASRRTAAAPLQHGATWRNVAQHVATRHNLAQHVATLRLNAPPVLFPLSSRGRITLCYLPLPLPGLARTTQAFMR